MKWLVLLLVLLVLVLVLVVWWLIRRPTQRAIERSRRAIEGEGDAEALLEAEGWTVLERQHSVQGCMRIDEELVYYTVRIDLLVERDGEMAVAEVKTGGRAPDPSYGPTRRQLLEYGLLFPDCALLLVDVEAGRVHEVEILLPADMEEQGIE